MYGNKENRPIIAALEKVNESVENLDITVQKVQRVAAYMNQGSLEDVQSAVTGLNLSIRDVEKAVNRVTASSKRLEGATLCLVFLTIILAALTVALLLHHG